MRRVSVRPGWAPLEALRVLVALTLLMAPIQAMPAGAPAGVTLHIGVQLEPPILDPTAGAAAPIAEVSYGSIYEGLVDLGADGVPRPALARAWTISDDGLVYVFSLLPDVRFHDGTPFDARSVRFALDRARDAASVNPLKSALAAIVRVEVVDALTVRVVLSRRAGSLLQTLGMASLAMVSPASADDDRTHPVGTGPFRFVAWNRGDSVMLARFDGYHGAPARPQTVVYKFIADPSAAYAALMAGDVDLFPNFPAPENLAQFKADPRFQVDVGGSEGKAILAINNQRAPLDRLDVRRAIAYALDRRAIIDGAMFGYGVPIGSHFAPGNAAFVDLTGRYPHDPAAARSLLVAAGAQPVRPLRMKLPPTPYARRSGEIIAAQLGAVGIHVVVENLEWAQWLDQVYTRHDFDLSVIVHAEALDYAIYGRDDYYFGYRSPEARAQLARLEETVDPAQRITLLQDLQRRIAEDAVNGFLFQYPRLTVRDAHLRGLPQAPVVGGLPLAGAWLDTAAGASASTGTPGLARPVLGWTAALVALALAMRFVVAAARRCPPTWLAHRLLGLALTVLLASGVVFGLVQIAPGDPARVMMGMDADPQAVANLRHQLGLDAPALQRYAHWIAGMAQGDFGISYTYRVPIVDLLRERLQVTLPLALFSMLLAVAIALPLGLLSAARRGRWLDHTLGALTQLGVAIPNFWFGILLSLVFAVGLRWLPAGGFAGWDHGWLPGLRSLVLPAFALGVPQAAILARVLRGALVDTLHEDYLRTARAKGVSGWRALWRHALPNALVPVLTILGMQFSFLLAGGVIIENVFFLPGLGRLLFQAVAQRDLMLLQSVVLLLALAMALVSFLVEVAYRTVDPRLDRSLST